MWCLSVFVVVPYDECFCFFHSFDRSLIISVFIQHEFVGNTVCGQISSQ